MHCVAGVPVAAGPAAAGVWELRSPAWHTGIEAPHCGVYDRYYVLSSSKISKSCNCLAVQFKCFCRCMNLVLLRQLHAIDRDRHTTSTCRGTGVDELRVLIGNAEDLNRQTRLPSLLSARRYPPGRHNSTRTRSFKTSDEAAWVAACYLAATDQEALSCGDLHFVSYGCPEWPVHVLTTGRKSHIDARWVFSGSRSVVAAR